jgi:hypothetical protein
MAIVFVCIQISHSVHVSILSPRDIKQLWKHCDQHHLMCIQDPYLHFVHTTCLNYYNFQKYFLHILCNIKKNEQKSANVEDLIYALTILESWMPLLDGEWLLSNITHEYVKWFLKNPFLGYILDTGHFCTKFILYDTTDICDDWELVTVTHWHTSHPSKY